MKRAASGHFLLQALIVAVVALLLVGVFGHLDRYWVHDESVYLSQLLLDRPLSWGPQRSVGVLALAAIAVRFVDEPGLGRMLVGVITTAVLILAYGTWATVVTRRMALVALVLGLIPWITLHHLSSVMPNLLVGAAAVAMVGSAAAYGAKAKRGFLVSLVIASAVATLLRPPDAAWLVAAVIVGGLALKEFDGMLPVALAAVAGAFLGIIPWIIESFRRFDDPVNRILRLSELADTRLRSNLGDYMKLADGPQLGPDSGAVPWVVLASIAVLVVALVAAWRSGMEPGPKLALLTAAVFAVPYAFFYVHTAPRFLLSSILLLSIPAAQGAIRLFSGRPWVRIGYVAVTCVVVAIQTSTLHAVSAEEHRSGISVVATGEALKLDAAGRPCTLMAHSNIGQLTLSSPCRVRRADLQDADQVEGLVYAVRQSSSRSLGEGWIEVENPGSAWRVFKRP